MRRRRRRRRRRKSKEKRISYFVYTENLNERWDVQQQCTCESLPVYLNFTSAARAYLSMHEGIVNTRTHVNTHSDRLHIHIYTIPLPIITIIITITTAIITTIIGCLSIRLTPSSGPNYYVTIFIDNKKRNKHWSNNCNKKGKKEGKMTFRRLSRHIGITINLVLLCGSIYVYPGDCNTCPFPLDSRVDINQFQFSLSLFRTKIRKKQRWYF